MAFVVLLRGVNVGGQRRFRPSALAARLNHLDAVNIGAAGTFVVRKPVGRAQLRAEFARQLPFEADVVICSGPEVARLLSRDFFSRARVEPDMVRFVAVMPRLPRSAPAVPVRLPATGRWLVRVLAREGRFLVGLYRRDMRTIGHLGALDRMMGARLTTRNWNTFAVIARALDRMSGAGAA